MMNLYHGDCLEIVPTLETGSVDAIITDLTYGTTACKWDTVIEFAPMWKEVKRVLKPNGAFITTASQPFTSALIMSNPKAFRYEWIWNKDFSGNFVSANRAPMKRHENIVVFSEKAHVYNPIMTKKDKPIDKRKWMNDGSTSQHYQADVKVRQRVLTHSYPSSIINGFNAVSGECNNTNRIHPTQKPVALYEYLIRTYTNEGETVLDIAMGSGTTIEAAERTGRNSIGIEKDEGIFQSAVLRLKSFTPSNIACSGRVDSSGSPELFPAEVSSPAKVTRQSTRR